MHFLFFVFLWRAFGDDIQPFTIRANETLLQRLKSKLDLAEFPDQLSDVDLKDWSYGIPLEYVRELVDYWQHSYDWRTQEIYLNKFSHNKVTIDNLNIHFIHQRSSRKNAIPLIIVHGWPGSFMECLKAIPELTEPQNVNDIAFHVVCPSLPGYGFSDAPKRKGFGVKQIALIFIKLMEKLGYATYVAQGGDWGSCITTVMADLDQSHVIGLHINFIITGPPFRKGIWSFLKTAISFVFPSSFFDKNPFEQFF